MLFKRTPPSLSKIKAGSANEIAAKYPIQPEAKSLLSPEQTPGEFLQALEQNKMPMDSMNFLANGMSEQDSVFWATQSTRKVSDKLNPSDQAALQAAEQWVQNPTGANQAAAAQAAEAAGMQGPGAWAAQAASWAQDPASAAPQPGTPGSPALTAAAVVGSILLASGLVKGPSMPETPKPKAELAPPDMDLTQPSAPQAEIPGTPSVDQPTPPQVDNNKLAKSLKPFMELGKQIADGKLSWA